MSTVIEVLVALILIGILTMVFTGFAGKVINNDAFERTYTASNTALLMDSIYASPNNLDYVYLHYLSNQRIEIDEGNVRVYKPNQTNFGVIQAHRFGYSDVTKLKTSSLVFYDGKTINFLITQVPKKIEIINESNILNSIQGTVSCPALDTHLEILNSNVLFDRLAAHYDSNKDSYRSAFSILQILAADNYAISTKQVLEQADFDKVLESAKDKQMYILIVNKKEQTSSVNVILKTQSPEFDKFFCIISGKLKEVGLTATKEYGFKGDYEKYGQISSKYAIIIEYNTDEIYILSNVIKNSVGEFFK